jgi:tetratricopeptide (TPR) repeat protein
MSDGFTDKLDKIIIILIKTVIILLPLFFLPWTSEYFEFNKQLLLWLAVPAAIFLWFYKMAIGGQLKIKSSPLNTPILIFLLLTAAASCFSLDRFSSFFGYFGRFSDAWLGLLSLAGLYFLLVNTAVADGAKKIIGLLELFTYSGLVVAGVALLAMLGGLRAISGDPLSIFSSPSFNPAGGSLLSLAVFLALIAVILLDFLVSRSLKKLEGIFLGAGLAMILLDLALIDFTLSWAILLAGAILIMLFHLLAGACLRGWRAGRLAQQLAGQRIFSRSWLLAVVLALVAILMLVWPRLNLARPALGRELPKEALLTYGQSWAVVKEVVKQYPALGSGPGTFAQDFSFYRPVELNQSLFWQIRFDKGSSHFLEMLATSGFLAGLSYLLIISLAVYLNAVLIRKYFRVLSQQERNLIAVLFIVFALLAFAQFLFLTNTVLNFAFWLCLGLLAAFWQSHEQALFKEKIINLNGRVFFQRLGLAVLFFLSAAWLVLATYEIKFFTADVLAAQKTNRQTALIMAIKLNPYRYNYQVSLAKFYLNKARAEAVRPAERGNQAAIQQTIGRAIDAAKQAAVRAPNSVLALETLGLVYRDSRPLTLGSEPWSVKAFAQALALEPTNPALASELAKAYVNNNDLVNAKKYFYKALELKSDYYEAKFALAKAYLKEKKDSEALVLLEELAHQIYDTEVYYELGRFYYNHGQIDKAINEFKRVLGRMSGHANSLYSLGLAYEAQGDIKEALKYFAKVLELNPRNKEVMGKIKILTK